MATTIASIILFWCVDATVLDAASMKYPEVSLLDLQAFPFTAEETRRGWMAASTYVEKRGTYVWTYYGESNYRIWEAEADWSKQCWDALDNVLRIGGKEYKLGQLNRLRLLLGERNYRAGLMPDNIPEWMLFHQ